MIPWWWAIVAIVVGVFIGILVVALVTANGDE